MNTKNFTKWLLEKLLPNLPPRSAVVMDNARYPPTQTNKTLVSNIQLQKGNNVGNIMKHLKHGTVFWLTRLKK